MYKRAYVLANASKVLARYERGLQLSSPDDKPTGQSARSFDPGQLHRRDSQHHNFHLLGYQVVITR